MRWKNWSYGLKGFIIGFIVLVILLLLDILFDYGFLFYLIIVSLPLTLLFSYLVGWIYGKIKYKSFLYIGIISLILAGILRLTLFRPSPYGEICFDYCYNPLLDYFIYPLSWLIGIVFTIIGVISLIKKEGWKKAIKPTKLKILVIIILIILGISYILYCCPANIPKERCKRVDLEIQDISCNISSLTFTLENTGTEGLYGYNIFAYNNSNNNSDIIYSRVHLNDNFIGDRGKSTGTIPFTSNFPTDKIPFKQGEKSTDTFNLTEQIYSIEIYPVLYIERDNRNGVTYTCGNIIKKDVICV